MPTLSQMLQADVIALLRRLYPADYIEPILAGSGSDVVYAVAAVMERCSLAAVRLSDCLTPGTAPVGVHATGNVTLSRTGLAAGTLAIGSILWSVYGDRFVTLEAGTWALNDTADKTVAVQSLGRSWQGNRLTGDVLGVLRPSPSPMWDTSVLGTVAVPGLTGGVSPELEALAATRGLGRQREGTFYRVGETAESPESLRLRIRSVADIITRPVIERVTQAVIPACRMYEPDELCAFSDYACWTDATRAYPTLAADGDGYNNFTPCLPGATGFFVLTVPCPVVALQDLALCYSDYGHTDYQDGYAANALPALLPDGTPYDMGNHGLRKDVSALASQAERTRAGGVHFQVQEVTP